MQVRNPGPKTHAERRTSLPGRHNRDSRELTEVMQLELLGFRVIIAESGDKAMTWAMTWEESSGEPIPCAVLSDYSMPGALQGDALLENLRGRWPSIHCVLMSGHLQGATTRCKVLQKPFSIDELSAALAPVIPGERIASPSLENP